MPSPFDPRLDNKTSLIQINNTLETLNRVKTNQIREQKYEGWQVLIDSLLEFDSSGGPCRHGAIFGRDGSLWAKTTNFPPITIPELTRIKRIFTDDTHIAQYGVYLAGRKYIYYGKYDFSWSSIVAQCQGPEGWCTIMMTTSAVIIGISQQKITSAIVSFKVKMILGYRIYLWWGVDHNCTALRVDPDPLLALYIFNLVVFLHNNAQY